MVMKPDGIFSAWFDLTPKAQLFIALLWWVVRNHDHRRLKALVLVH